MSRATGRVAALLRCIALVLAFAGSNAVLAQGVTLPDVGRIELENGVVIILHEKDDVPLRGQL